MNADGTTEAPLLESIRFVVFDTETTGLDVHRDRLISIGAVALKDGQIIVEDSFEALIPVVYNSATVVYHGITREESQKGRPERETLVDFASYARGGVLVGHHVGTDLQVLAISETRLNLSPTVSFALDTGLLARWLQEHFGQLNGHILQRFSLEELCRVYTIPMHDRHTAAGDAFLTALLFQRLLRLASRAGLTTLEALCGACRISLSEYEKPPA
ncbi:MAG: 3'-5' exonuclease [Verrucomicrobiota bacterium]|nr:3'-5' exonuclease [Verrucomicrobiota bacterium]